MTTHLLRILLALPVTVVLAACGGATDIASGTPRTAAMVQASPTVAAQEPQPDCAPERCAGLRIIDGNAEAYRLQAQQRAALDTEDDPQA